MSLTSIHEWDFQAFCVIIDDGEEDIAVSCIEEPQIEHGQTIIRKSSINYQNDWIVDFGCSNHMTKDKEKLSSATKYKEGRIVVTVDDSMLPISHIGDTVIIHRYIPHKVKLQNVYLVPMMKKNLLLISQLTLDENYIVFKPNNEKVYRNLKLTNTQ
ncbi:hypothetical protein V6Z11_A01G058800 [Gossypium hirsutum]